MATIDAHELVRTRFCAAPSCAVEVTSGEQFCAAHRAERNRRRPPARLPADRLGLDVEALTGGWDGWVELLQRVASVGSASRFWLGDMLCDRRFPTDRMYQAAAEATGETIRRLYVYCWVSGSVARDRRVALSWSHHRAVAALTPRMQSQRLRQALEHHLTVAELVAAIGGDADVDDEAVRVPGVVVEHRGRRREILRAPDDLALLRLEIRAPADHIAWWRRCVDERGVTFSALVTELLMRELGPFPDSVTAG